MISTAEFIISQQPGILYSLTLCAVYALAAFAAGCLISRRSDVIAFAAGLLISGVFFFSAFSLVPGVWTACGNKTVILLLLVFACCGIFFLFRSLYKKTLLFLSGGLLFAVLAGSALLPPYSWDEQVYQLGLLSRYCFNRSIAVLPDNPYSAWPGFLQFFLLPGWITGGMNFPRLFNTLLFVILAGGLYSSLRIYGKKTAFVLTAATCLSPLAMILTRSLYAENTVALFTLAGVLTLVRLRKKPAAACLLAGAFAGGAMAVKLTSGGAALALFLLCAFDRRNRKYLLLFIAGAAAVLLPYFFRIWYHTGNPFYPFAPEIFGTSRAVADYHYQLGAARYGMGPLYGTVFGWITTAFAGKLYDGAVSGFQQPAILLLLFGFLRFSRTGRYHKWIKRFLIPIAVMYLFWGLTSQQTRFLYPALFLLAFPAAAALNGLSCRMKNVFLLMILAGTFLTSDLYPHLKHFFISWKIVKPVRQDPLRFLSFAQRDPDFIQILEAAGKTPRGSRILLLFERRGFYLPRRHENADPGFQDKYFKTLPQTVDELMAELKDADYLLTGSNEKNVDLQEKDLEIQKHLMMLINSAVSQNRLKIVISSSRNTCHLLKKQNSGDIILR